MNSMFDRRTQGRIVSILFNVLTVVTLLATIGVGLTFAALVFNPYLPFNPYPPPTLPATLGPPTATHTPQITLGPTWTPTITSTPGPSRTPTPTLSPTASLSPTPQDTPAPGAQFDIQTGSPVLTADTRGCDVMAIGGKLFDLSGATIVPPTNIGVHIAGALNAEPVEFDTVIGSGNETLGIGGYLVDVATKPIASNGTLTIQLIDIASGLPFSEPFALTTSSSCEENLILVNWRQIR